MEFKGTKGKWSFEYDNSDNSPTEWYDILSEKGLVLSRNYNNRDFQEEEMRANALLISKAPEMLEIISELLKELEFHGYRHSTTIYNANELIKEATTLEV